MYTIITRFRKTLLLAATMLASVVTKAQPLNSSSIYSLADTLRGSITPERAWWDVLHYSITVNPDYAAKSISGKVTIQIKPLKKGNLLQLDLQQPMMIDSIKWENMNAMVSTTWLRFKRTGNVYLAEIPNFKPEQNKNPYNLTAYFHGTPREALRPPWDGGWIWQKDKKGNPWMSVACQGLGASVWYPCKDHQGDEPDFGATLSIIAPDSLMAVGNGRLTEKKAMGNGKTTYTWDVKAPINNYCIVPYIGKYVNFNEMYNGVSGPLSLNYWVLDYNLAKAKKQFTDVPRMMKAFEHWFGPYPFYKDGYQLVDAPHLGMEHQSATAYGNDYRMGYSGTDLSGTGWGLKWDFIIVHESGHEWFANSISTDDIADMWVHEGFTNYSETLFTEYFYGKKAGTDYVEGIRKQIANDIPIIGTYGVNKEGSTDMYYKGANMLHTIRSVINDDEKFRNILKGLNKEFYHKITTTKQVEAFISKKSGINFSKVFDQYLRTIKVPVLQYKINGTELSYRWSNCVPGFTMPVKVTLSDSNYHFIYPVTDAFKTEKLPATGNNKLKVDRNFYVEAKKV